MAYYGYIRASKEPEAGRCGMDPETQPCALTTAGARSANV